MSVTSTIAANLLVPASLEALLSRSSTRLDHTAMLQRLHAAALLECAIKGYADLKVTDIAERARVSTASIYKTYKDRDALLVAAIKTLFSILANDVIALPQHDDPIKRVEHLLIAHGEVYAQPLSTWLFRLYASLAWSGQTDLRETGLAVFQGIDSFWYGFLNQLIGEGHLVAFEPKDIVPHLLGPIERCTIIWQLGCGDDDGDRREKLAQVAAHGAQALFKLWGHASANGASRPLMPPANDRIFDPTLSQLHPMLPPNPQATPNAASRLNEKLATFERQSTTKEKKERLALSAAALCQERGFQKASMGEVAARAKVSTATMYKLYKDKADLFADAVESEFRLLIAFEDMLVTSADPQTKIANALFVLAARATDPQWVWIYHLMMASEISGTPRIIALAREHHSADEAHLGAVLTSLTELKAYDKQKNEAENALSLNFLLGAIERHSVLSLILFGSEAVEADRLEQLASVSTASYLRLLATPD
jgi:AcrR family transcriptional regulator